MITETTPTANDHAAILAGPCTAGFVASGADRVAEHLIQITIIIPIICKLTSKATPRLTPVHKQVNRIHGC